MLTCVSRPSYNMIFNQWRVSGKWTGVSRLKAHHASRGYACGRCSEQCPYTNVAKCLVRWEHEFDIICVQENEHFEKSRSLKLSSVNYQASWYSPRRSLFYRWKSWKWEFTQFAPNHSVCLSRVRIQLCWGEKKWSFGKTVETNKGKAIPRDDGSRAFSWLAKDLIPEGCW